MSSEAKKTDAVICTLNAKYVHASLAPWCLLAGVRQYAPEISADVEEGTINESPEILADKVLSHHPRVIGISVYIWNAEASYRLASIFRAKSPRVVLVLGGPEVGYQPKKILREHREVDYILSGEGEYPFAMFLLKQIAGKNVPIPGLSYRVDSGIVVAEPYVATDAPPSPYLPEFFSRLGNRIAYLETSRGCPFRCAFCLSGRVGTVRFFSLEEAKRELLALAASGAKTVKLVDRTFNANPARAADFFRFIAQKFESGELRNTRVHFEIAADLLEEETLSILERMPKGAVQLEIGLQSYHLPTLAAICRKTDAEKWENAVRRLVKPRNIHIHIDLIAGLPKEDLQTFRDGFDRAWRLQTDMLQLGFLKLIPGCAMRENPEKYPCEFDPEPPYEVRKTPFMSENDLSLIHFCEEGLERLSNKGHWRRTLEYLFSLPGIRPFDFFAQFGAAYLAAEKKDPLTLTEMLYRQGIQCRGCEEALLHDHMLCDSMSYDSSGTIPDVLKSDPEQYAKCRRKMNESCKQLFADGIRARIGIMKTKDCVIFARYDPERRDPITEEFPLRFCSVDDFLKSNKENITL